MVAVSDDTRADRFRITGRGERTRIKILLSPVDLASLERVADYYNRNWGKFRHVVRLLSGPQTRARFQMVSQEAQSLSGFIRGASEGEHGSNDAWVEFTPLAAVAFWGRLLSSLRSPRARRKLKREEVEHRERLADLFAAAAGALRQKDPGLLETVVASRRLSEQEWMNGTFTSAQEAAQTS